MLLCSHCCDWDVTEIWVPWFISSKSIQQNVLKHRRITPELFTPHYIKYVIKIDCPIFLVITAAAISFAVAIVSNYSLEQIPTVPFALKLQLSKQSKASYCLQHLSTLQEKTQKQDTCRVCISINLVFINLGFKGK